MHLINIITSRIQSDDFILIQAEIASTLGRISYFSLADDMIRELDHTELAAKPLKNEACHDP